MNQTMHIAEYLLIWNGWGCSEIVGNNDVQYTHVFLDAYKLLLDTMNEADEGKPQLGDMS